MSGQRDTAKTAHRRSQRSENSAAECGGQPSYVVTLTRDKARSIRRVLAEVTEKIVGPTEGGTPPKRVFERLYTVHVKCSNPDCRDGGIYLLPIIEDMLRNRETDRLFMEMCPERVPAPSRGPVVVRCQNMFCVKILLA